MTGAIKLSWILLVRVHAKIALKIIFQANTLLRMVYSFMPSFTPI